MKKLVNCLYLSFAVAVFGISALKPALAQDLITNNYNNNILIKKVAIYRTLAKYNSPLVNEVDAFLNACMSYGINCYLLPSISGVESTFGRFLMPDSHNPFGWGGGYLYFPSWHPNEFHPMHLSDDSDYHWYIAIISSNLNAS